MYVCMHVCMYACAKLRSVKSDNYMYYRTNEFSTRIGYDAMTYGEVFGYVYTYVQGHSLGLGNLSLFCT